MDSSFFRDEDIIKVTEALDVAEDVTGDFYKFSLAQWKRHRYDVRTLSCLRKYEITSDAFALLTRRTNRTGKYELTTKKRDSYLICLQDHQILKALGRDANVALLPLLIYVFTHELVHIVRFCNFLQRFGISGTEREKEERIVHETTYQILEGLSMPELDYVLDSYKDHRVCEMTRI